MSSSTWLESISVKSSLASILKLFSKSNSHLSLTGLKKNQDLFSKNLQGGEAGRAEEMITLKVIIVIV